MGGSTKYFGTVRDAAKQLGLISVKEGDVSLAVDSKCVSSYDSMREYIVGNIDTISEGLFFDVSKEYISMNEQVFKFKGVSEAALVEHMSKVIGKPVYEDDMRAWRFWATYLGLGNLHDMLLLPNMYTYLKAVLTVCNLKKNEEYTFTDFVAAIKPYAEIGLSDLMEIRKSILPCQVVYEHYMMKELSNYHTNLIVVICGSYMKQNYIQLNQQLLM